jgi:hypothetical protein
VLGIDNSEIIKVIDDSVQKEIDINTEVLGIVNGEIVNVTDDSVQKEIDIKTEVLGIVNGEKHCHLLHLLFHYKLSLTILC